jgi:hypothetical protein
MIGKIIRMINRGAMKTSISDNIKYPELCKKAAEDDEIFANFKSIPIYQEILEHVDFNLGLEYLDYLRENSFPFFDKLDKFKENDKYGNVKKFGYPDIGNISPTTLRYMKVMFELYQLFGDLNGKVICEIGGGYGGQCKIINDVFQFAQYYLFDLPEAALLAEKYLSKLNVKNVLFNEEYDNFDLFISNYALTECCRDIQLEYINKYAKKSKHGYITGNFVSKLFNIDSLSKDELIGSLSCHDVKVLEEKPNTYPNNVLIVW